MARFTREETLSKLRLELWNKRVTTIGQLRGARRLLIISGPKDHIIESFKRANPLKSALVERGVLIVPYFSDGGNCSAAELLSLFPEDSETTNLQEPSPEGFSVEDLDKRFLAFPLYTNEWSKYASCYPKSCLFFTNISPTFHIFIFIYFEFFGHWGDRPIIFVPTKLL